MYVMLPACLSCLLFNYQLSVRFNLVIGSLLAPLNLNVMRHHHPILYTAYIR